MRIFSFPICKWGQQFDGGWNKLQHPFYANEPYANEVASQIGCHRCEIHHETINWTAKKRPAKYANELLKYANECHKVFGLIIVATSVNDQILNANHSVKKSILIFMFQTWFHSSRRGSRRLRRRPTTPATLAILVMLSVARPSRFRVCHLLFYFLVCSIWRVDWASAASVRCAGDADADADDDAPSRETSSAVSNRLFFRRLLHWNHRNCFLISPPVASHQIQFNSIQFQFLSIQINKITKITKITKIAKITNTTKITEITKITKITKIAKITKTFWKHFGYLATD